MCETTTARTRIAFVSVYSPGLHQQHQEKKKGDLDRRCLPDEPNRLHLTSK